MDPTIIFNTIQTVFNILGVFIAAIQLHRQWPRHDIGVSISVEYIKSEVKFDSILIKLERQFRLTQ